VLLILGGALAAGLLVVQSGKRVPAIEISQAIGAGQQVPLSAMQEVQIASNSGLAYVPWSEASQVARYFAVSAIPPGTLLTSAMVVRTSTSTAGKAVVGLALKDGQLPSGLQVGDHVDVFQVSNAQQSCPGAPGTILAANAVVLAVTTPSATSGSSAMADVEVAVNPANAGAVTCNASNGIAGIAVLPAGATARGASGAANGATSATPGPRASGTPGPRASATHTATPSPAGGPKHRHPGGARSGAGSPTAKPSSKAG
jgi:hypothetical protein